MARFDARAGAAAFKETYALTQSGEPIARSDFDVYIDERNLHYFKQPCDTSDLGSTFFLSVFPTNPITLRPDDRQQGFANLDFAFELEADGLILDGACAATVKLPAYEIASVSTGQYIYEEDGAITNLWIVEFPVGSE